MSSQIDMLLLNCSNLPWRPIFPYAFVQVSEVARRFGLNIKRVDMLHVRNWAEKISELIRLHRPRSIGIHLRQGDSIDLSDYMANGAPKSEYFRTYYPIDDSKTLIEIIRKNTNAPVIMGGFGFTTHARNIARHLEIDMGVQGCPDGFFRHFNEALEGRSLTQIPGLVHHDGGTYIYNPQELSNPAENREYNEELVNELKSFYGDMLKQKNPPTIAVEISRGCPFQCYFCTEPDVKGKRVNYRNQDVIISELDFLMRKDFKDFWFICSEINIGGTGFILELAEKVVRLNEKYKDRKIRWSGYSLPTLEYDELALLQRAGYSGAMNDLLSLDEDNLRRAKVPYKKKQAVSFLKSMISLREESSEGEAGEQVKFTASTPSEYSGLLSFFFGNAHADAKTIPVTLEEIDREGLSGYYSDGYVIPSSRVFPIGRTKSFTGRPGTVSISKSGFVEPQTLLPTFYFPDFLMETLGSRESILEFFDYVTSTFMSKAHTKKRDFYKFLSDQEAHECLAKIRQEVSSKVSVGSVDIAGGSGELWNQQTSDDAVAGIPGDDKGGLSDFVHTEIRKLFDQASNELTMVIETIGPSLFIGTELVVSEYSFTKSLYRHFDSIEQLRRKILSYGKDASGVDQVFLNYLIYITNLKIQSNYRDLLFRF